MLNHKKEAVSIFISVLRLWFGDKIFVSLIEKQIISFLKYAGWVAYLNKGIFQIYD